jgi:hypothetical protein
LGLFLQILGGLCLLVMVVTAAIIVGFLVLRKRLGSALEGLADMRYAVTPPRLHLVRYDHPAWKDPATVTRHVEGLRALGFQEAGTFGTEEMDFVRVHALAHPEQCIYAVVYEHDKAGIFMDLVTSYEDGTALTYTTTTEGEQLDQRPGHGKVRIPDGDAAELYGRLVAERPQRPMKPAPVEGFPAAFEKAYADAMDWRGARGYSEDEIRRLAEASGQEATDEVVAAVRAQMEAQAAAGLQEGLKERYLEQTSMSAAEWERVRERVVFIHDRLNAEQVEEIVGEWVSEDESDYSERIPADAPGRQAFAAVNATLPERWRFEKLAEMSDPVPTDVYRAPEPDTSWDED